MPPHNKPGPRRTVDGRFATSNTGSVDPLPSDSSSDPDYCPSSESESDWSDSEDEDQAPIDLSNLSAAQIQAELFQEKHALVEEKRIQKAKVEEVSTLLVIFLIK